MEKKPQKKYRPYRALRDGHVVRLNFDLPRASVEQIDAEAQRLDRPRNWLLRRLVLEALEQKEKATA